MADYLEDSFHPESGTDCEGWQDFTARKLLQELGCQGPPIHFGYFQRWLALQSGGCAIQTPLSRTPRQSSKPVFQESERFQKAAKVVAAKYLKKLGPTIRTDCFSEVVDQLAFEIMAPKTWLESCWTASHELASVAENFPCLAGETMALRLGRFWKSSPWVSVGWFQGGHRVWSLRGGKKDYQSKPSGLEKAVGANTREYSRPVILRESGEEAQGIPFHQGFPKGEVVVHWGGEFRDQTD